MIGGGITRSTPSCALESAERNARAHLHSGDAGVAELVPGAAEPPAYAMWLYDRAAAGGCCPAEDGRGEGRSSAFRFDRPGASAATPAQNRVHGGKSPDTVFASFVSRADRDAFLAVIPMLDPGVMRRVMSPSAFCLEARPWAENAATRGGAAHAAGTVAPGRSRKSSVIESRALTSEVISLSFCLFSSSSSRLFLSPCSKPLPSKAPLTAGAIIFCKSSADVNMAARWKGRGPAMISSL